MIALEEKEIIEQAKKDPKYFEPLYEGYYHKIFSFLLKRHGQMDVAEEISSQAFLKALMNIKKFKYKENGFSSWLYKIALNESNGHFRKVKKNRVILIDEEIANQIAIESFPDGLEKSVQVLGEAIKQLKIKQLQILQLRYYESLSFKEIGEILDITENNAKVRCYRMLDQLRKLMPDS